MTAKVAESDARQALEQTRLEADELQQLIQAKEKEEERLRQELFDQEQSLALPDSSIIEQAMEKQNALNEELTEMQQSYASKESSLHEQQAIHADLNQKMVELEQSLAQTQQALADKEQELASAQESLASSTVKIEEQERALLDAQSQDFNLDEQASIEHIRPDIEKLPMPSDPQLWFDLVPFLQSASEGVPLPLTLSNLLDELEQSIHKTEALLEQDDLEGIEKMSKTLLTLAEKVHSDALIQLMQSIANDCSNGMADNVSIRWPATKQGIQRTVRVVYSHMH
jgi:epidermal growth factor receptor substrate 15